MPAGPSARRPEIPRRPPGPERTGPCPPCARRRRAVRTAFGGVSRAQAGPAFQHRPACRRFHVPRHSRLAQAASRRAQVPASCPPPVRPGPRGRAGTRKPGQRAGLRPGVGPGGRGAARDQDEDEGLAPSPRLWLPGRHPVFPGSRGTCSRRQAESHHDMRGSSPFSPQARKVLRAGRRGRTQPLPFFVYRPFRARQGRAVPSPAHAGVRPAFQAVAAMRETTAGVTGIPPAHPPPSRRRSVRARTRRARARV